MFVLSNQAAVALVVGVSYLLEMFFVLTSYTITLSDILITAFGLNPKITTLLWVITLLISLSVNLNPYRLFKFSIYLSSFSIAILIICILITIPSLDYSSAFQTVLKDGSISSEFLPFGFEGVIKAFPYSIFLFKCFEILPAASEETKDVRKNLPRGMFFAMVTITIMSWLSLMTFAAMKPGIAVIGTSISPLGTALQNVFGSQNPLILLVTVPALIVGQMCGLYAGSRFLYGLSRGGYIHDYVSTTNSDGTPWFALLIITIFVFYLSFIANYTTSTAADIFANIGIIYALFAYIIEPVIFIRLRFSLPSLPRPFKSPVGVSGSVIQLFIAAFMLVTCLIYIDLFKTNIIVVSVTYFVSLSWYGLIIREKFASEGNEKKFSISS